MQPKKIFICAGELSGDLLAASLIKAIQRIDPQVTFYGLTGPNMRRLGCHSFADLNKLSVIGLTEVLKRVPFFLRLKKNILQYILDNEIGVFIGMDFTEFNLSLEKTLRKKGIRTCHYKSPTVWAWRRGRLNKIRKAVDKILLLFPFEKKIYQEANISACYIGHPMADQIPLKPDIAETRLKLGIPIETQVIALLPGSRVQEVAQLLPDFLKAAHKLTAIAHRDSKAIQFLLPIASSPCRILIQKQIQAYSTLPLRCLEGHSQSAMQAADLVILASGTATLEAMLLKKPMLICYRLSWLSYQCLRRLVYIKQIGLPNILAGRSIMPELIQNDLNCDNLVETALIQLARPQSEWLQSFEAIHRDLKCDASTRAARAVLTLYQTEADG